MDYKRLVLFSALLFISLNLYQAWIKDYPEPQSQQVVETKTSVAQSSSGSDTSYLPNVAISNTKNKTAAIANPVFEQQNADAKLLTIKTDLLELSLDANSGNIVGAKLLDYALSPQEKDKAFRLFSDDLRKYVANSSLFVKTQDGVQDLPLVYQSTASSFELAPTQSKLDVVLKAKTPDGLVVEKTISVERGRYLINFNYKVLNNTSSTWVGQVNNQLLQKNPKLDKSSMFHVGTYTGAAISDPKDKLYKKVSFEDIASKNLDKTIESGWVAMQEHYFLSAWVPPAGTTNHFYSRYVDSQYIVGFVSEPLVIEPSKSKTVTNSLYAGPEVTSRLEKIAPGLNLTIDYGILSVISIFIFTVMSYIYKVVGNWGWSIVLVTMLIKLAFYQLSAKSYRSMASMRRLQPKITELRDRYADDKAKLSQVTMELYRKEKVNPLGGCLPILIQMPVFIALYWMLMESVELRQAPWMLWIHDLSSPDPLYILPVLMGLTMFIQQKLGPASPDPTQAKMMMMLPVLFTFLFSSFPAGLVLYWTVNNSLSILQQWYITRKYGEEQSKKKGSGSLVTSK